MAIFEICASSFQSAVNAEKGGADRIELCQNLEGGGTTPSTGLIRLIKQKLVIPVYVLIRPRTGDFVYDDDEFAIMLEDIRVCRDLQCDGVVVGILTQDNSVDVLRLRRLVEYAEPLPVTFHRAFDDCHDQFHAMEDIIHSGCVRILTSGGCDDAIAGSSRIAQLIEKARGRITVMPGAGITSRNLQELATATGATDYHASAKVSIDQATNSRFHATQLQSDLAKVRELVDIVHSLR